ncbi:MAG: hypothetical protein ACXVQ3_00220 [Gaiellaceae bacterium]
MTTVRMNSSLAAQLLLAHLRESTDVTVGLVSPDTVRVSLLGSYREDAMRLELYLRLRAWEAAQRAQGIEVRIELDDEEPGPASA